MTFMPDTNPLPHAIFHQAAREDIVFNSVAITRHPRRQSRHSTHQSDSLKID